MDRELTCAEVRRAIAAAGITSPHVRVTATRPDPVDSPFTFCVTIPRASAVYAGLHRAAADPGCAGGLQAVAHTELRLGRRLGRAVRISEVTQRRSRVTLTVHT